MKTRLKVSGRRVLSLRAFGQDSLKSASTPTGKRISLCVLGLMLVLCLCGAVPKANAVIFVNQGYGTCLDASGGYLKTFVDGGTCNATFAQQWNFEGHELQGIGSNNTTGANCVWATGGVGSAVLIAPCNGGQSGWNNEWYLAGGHIYNYINDALCMDLSGGPGTQVRLENCTGSASQTWSANAIVFVNQGYGTCLDASGGYLKTFADGGTCNATFAQQWNFAGYELQGIGSNNTTGANCVWATGGVGSAVLIAPCNSGQSGWNNLWTYENGYIVNYGLCMDLSGGPGTQVRLENCTGSASQTWSPR